MDETPGIDKLADMYANSKAASKLNTEDAIALRFAEENASRLRYVNEWGKWYYRTGQRWGKDATLLAFDMAHVTSAAMWQNAPEQERRKALRL